MSRAGHLAVAVTGFSGNDGHCAIVVFQGGEQVAWQSDPDASMELLTDPAGSPLPAERTGAERKMTPEGVRYFAGLDEAAAGDLLGQAGFVTAGPWEPYGHGQWAAAASPATAAK